MNNEYRALIGTDEHYKQEVSLSCAPYGVFQFNFLIFSDQYEELTESHFKLMHHIQDNWKNIWQKLIPVFEDLSNSFSYIQKSFLQHLKCKDNYFEISISDIGPEGPEGQWSMHYHIKSERSGFYSMSVYFKNSDEIEAYQPAY